MKFFEIAESFDTEYIPATDSVIGYIKPIGLDKVVKMTELGVGFSQLAPIILLCITSSPGTTILLEQPELHLHPKVQQKFADFIVEMIEKNDLQIILETHSDHILNRIRRRVAQAKIEENDSSLFQKCAILFAERENGVTSFRKAKLTDSGMFDLTDYPDGFFDQGAEDAFYILKASLDHLLIETDSPYLAPVPMRGKENEPSYIKYTGEYLAKFYSMTKEDFFKLTDNNFYKLFSRAKKDS